jgi:hypothetical protein
MAGTLARVTDFIPSTPILSGEVDSEFNQLVNLLNSTTTNVKAALKVSDAGDPPLELNQLSTGPILKGFQAGIEKFRFRNDGALATPAIRDANDNEQLIFVPTASAVNEFSMANAATGNPPELRVTGGDTDISVKLVPKGAGVVKIQSAAPAAAEDASNKSYVDTRRGRWAATFFIADVAARGVDINADNIQRALIPGSNFTATHIFLVATSGTNTGTFSVQIVKVGFNGTGAVVLDTISWNPGGGDSLGVSKEIDISDHNFTANDYIQAQISAVSSPLQKSVQVGIRGFQTPQNP